MKIYRFAGVRPDRPSAPEIAAVPYDVVTAEEARGIIVKKPRSFLRVSRPDAEMPVHLRFESLKDFSPESVAQQVPELSKLLELRKALLALKGPLGNIPGFRKKLQALLESGEDVDKILRELGAGEAEEGKGEEK